MEQPKNLLSFEGISAIAFNKDQTMCVAAHKDKNLIIYKITSLNDCSKWEVKYTLKSVRKCFYSFIQKFPYSSIFLYFDSSLVTIIILF